MLGKQNGNDGGAVLHSSWWLEHHGGETYLHCLRGSATARRRRIDGVSRNTTGTGGGLLQVQLFAARAIFR